MDAKAADELSIACRSCRSRRAAVGHPNRNRKEPATVAYSLSHSPFSSAGFSAMERKPATFTKADEGDCIKQKKRGRHFEYTSSQTTRRTKSEMQPTRAHEIVLIRRRPHGVPLPDGRSAHLGVRAVVPGRRRVPRDRRPRPTRQRRCRPPSATASNTPPHGLQNNVAFRRPIAQCRRCPRKTEKEE